MLSADAFPNGLDTLCWLRTSQEGGEKHKKWPFPTSIMCVFEICILSVEGKETPLGLSPCDVKRLCLRLFCFIQGKFVYVCHDYKSLPRHRGFWENLESERERSSSGFE